MRSNKNIPLVLLLLIVTAALYRIIPNRPFGFAPQWAMSLFAGAVIRDKKWAFALPVFSMFLSDLVYQVLYLRGLTPISGFYAGQITNYLLFAGMVVIGFFVKRISVLNIAGWSVVECSVFFLLSNFFVWFGHSGYQRPMTFDGLMACYADGLPFFVNSIFATLLFSGLLFGVYQLIRRRELKTVISK